jgi:hypothetical protein
VRFIPQTVHGIADYLVGVVITLPPLLVWNAAAIIVLIAIGGSVLLYSAMTDCELSVVGSLRVSLHLILDAVFGIVMLFLPLIINMNETARWPFTSSVSWRWHFRSPPRFVLKARLHPD